MSGIEIALPIISALGPTVLLIISEALGITATQGTSTCGSVIQLGVSAYQYIKQKLQATAAAPAAPEAHELDTIQTQPKPAQNDPMTFGL
jgi:hypothetical protein